MIKFVEESMYKIIIGIGLGLFLFNPKISVADIIQLNSGKSIEGKIVEQAREYVRVDLGVGVNLTYYRDEIRHIDTQPVLDQNLFNWIKSNVSSKTRLPLSFYSLAKNKKDIYANIGTADSLMGIMERVIVEEGISIYDSAVRQIVLTMAGGKQNLDSAYLPLKVYWRGNLGDLSSIRAGSLREAFIYDPENLDAVSSNLSDYGKRGFLFRIINVNGKYNTQDPLDGKTEMEGFPNWPTVHWEDWKPIAGENAWVVLSSLHLYHKKYFDSNINGYAAPTKTVELQLAEELARAAILLQAQNGGVRMAPMGTYYSLLDMNHDVSSADIERQLNDRSHKAKLLYPAREKGGLQEGAKERASEEVTWYYDEISTENNLSWYAAFRMLFEVTHKPIYQKAMKDIEGYFKEMWNEKDYVFYQGSHFTDGHWNPNNQHFATDVQTWAIIVLGPERIDHWFGEGSAYALWQKTKQFSGATDEKGKLLGVGYTEENDRISIEWTAGAILAAKTLAFYYQNTYSDWAGLSLKDSKEMREGIEAFRYELSEDQAAYSYSSKRGWIPFGWFSHAPDVMSLTSTCWVMLIDAEFNPFDLAGRNYPFQKLNQVSMILQ